MSLEATLGTANSALKTVSGVVDTVGAISTLAGNKKDRAQQQANWRENMDFAKQKYADDNKRYLANALQAQKVRQKNNYKEKLSDYKETMDDAKERTKLYAFINGIRGRYS